MPAILQTTFSNFLNKNVGFAIKIQLKIVPGVSN